MNFKNLLQSVKEVAEVVGDNAKIAGTTVAHLSKKVKDVVVDNMPDDQAVGNASGKVADFVTRHWPKKS